MSDFVQGHEELWEWFGLSRASFLVLPRALMHEMSDEWQGKMATLLHEYNAAYPFLENPGYQCHVVLREHNRYVKTPEWVVNYRHPNHVTIQARTR
jgi:hypothetical protein